MTRDGRATRAMVLSGGSVYAAYEVGVMKALLKGESPATGRMPIDPDIYVGTSAGSVNAALITSRADGDPLADLDYLEDIWLEELAAGDTRECRAGALRIRGDVTRFLNPRCLAADPLIPLLRMAEDAASFLQFGLARTAEIFSNREIPLGRRFLNFINISALVSDAAFTRVVYERIDLKRIRASPKALRIATTNWRTGELRLFSNDEMSDAIGHDVIRASSHLPGMPPVLIEGDPYVDGGYVFNTPLTPAIRAGADELHVVFMDPDIRNIPIPGTENAFDVLDKFYQITQATIFKGDINTAKDINRGLELLDGGVGGESGHSEADRLALLRAARRLIDRAGTPEAPRPLTIHLHHPREELGGTLGLTNFDRGHILDLISKGYADALVHDCRASGCIFPTGGPDRGGDPPSGPSTGTPQETDSTNGVAHA
jgi:predicted acylesterase/phospholipase RssA